MPAGGVDQPGLHRFSTELRLPCANLRRDGRQHMPVHAVIRPSATATATVCRGVVGVAVAVAVVVLTTPQTAARAAAVPSQRVVTAPVVAPTRPLDPEARAVARLFVLTAVARRHLRLAYYLAGPQIRQDLSLAEWQTGMIPVVPYPLDPRRLSEPKVDVARPSEVQLQVLLWSRIHPGESQSFVIGLIKRREGWLVDVWAPAAATAVPVG
jgi:hypothetical protein